VVEIRLDPKDEKELKEISEELIFRANIIFAEKGITEESITEVKEVLEHDYLELLPEKYHHLYMPVIGIVESEKRFMIGWRDISNLTKF
jgi:hypothetical protein